MNVSFSQVALLGSLVGFGLIGLVLPMVRHRLSHGHGSGLMLAHLQDPVGKVVGVGMAVQNASVISYAIAYFVAGPALLGVWSVPSYAAQLGLVLVALSTAIVATGQSQMGKSWRMCVDEKRTELVTSGLFSFCRNPIYFASNLLLFGVLLMSPSPWTVCLTASGHLLVALQVRLEEQHLVALHGQAYRDYAARVGRFVPGLGLMSRASAS